MIKNMNSETVADVHTYTHGYLLNNMDLNRVKELLFVVSKNTIDTIIFLCKKIKNYKILCGLLISLLTIIMITGSVYGANWTTGNIAAKTYTASETINLSGSVTLTGGITINSGVTLTIKGTGTITRGTSYTGALFIIKDGGSLVITGSKGNNSDIVINGNSSKVTAEHTIIDCYEKLSLKNVTLKNNKNTSNIAGGIHVRNKDINITITNCLITNCESLAGSGIYLTSTGSGPVKITKTIFEKCTTEGGTIRTNGGGNYQLTLEDCIVRDNTCVSHGAGIYWNANGTEAMLTIRDCQILNNHSDTYGAGLFLEGSNMALYSSTGTATEAIETGNIPSGGIVGTLIQGNTALGGGGGLWISGYGGGAGVGMSGTDSFNLTLGENVVIKNNSAERGGGIGMNLGKADPSDGYTYNIIIDGAQIYENEAVTDGGAILCQLNYNKYNVNFTVKRRKCFK